jgi:hypothetical protein
MAELKNDKPQAISINQIPDKPYLNLLEKVDFCPIFIMADHRSGTTLLYQTLVATDCFNFIKSYHKDVMFQNRRHLNKAMPPAGFAYAK